MQVVYVAAGLENRTIPNSAISASSSYDGYPAVNGRLNNGAWSYWASGTGAMPQWWQVDLGKRELVGKVAVQCAQEYNAFIRNYKLQFSDNGTAWTDYNNGEVIQGATRQSNDIFYKEVMPFRAQFVRFVVLRSQGLALGKFEVYLVAPTTFTAAGLESGAIPDSALTSSPILANHPTRLGRLNKVDTTYIWAVATNDANQWFQVDLGVVKWVGKVAVQGRWNTDQRITSYKLKYSNDGATWADYNNGEVLNGAADRTTPVASVLTPFRARYVRFCPVTWLNYIVGRFEVYVAD